MAVILIVVTIAVMLIRACSSGSSLVLAGIEAENIHICCASAQHSEAKMLPQ
jgi:hypothetical protein